MNKLSIREVVRYGFGEFVRHWKFFMFIVVLAAIVVGVTQLVSSLLLKDSYEQVAEIGIERQQRLDAVGKKIELAGKGLQTEPDVEAFIAALEKQYREETNTIHRESLSQTKKLLRDHWLSLLLAVLLTFIVNMGIFLGMLRVCLEYHDSGKQSYKTLFSCFGMVPKAFGVALIFLLIGIGRLVWQVIAQLLYYDFGTGAYTQWRFGWDGSFGAAMYDLSLKAVLLVPAYLFFSYFILRFAFVFFAMLDHKSIVQSWKHSWQISKGNFWRLFVLLVPIILLTNWYLEAAAIGGWLRPYLLALIALIFALLCMPYLLIWTRSYRALEAENG